MIETALSTALRTETRELHVQAERSGAMAALLRGQLSLAGYGAMVAALHEIYAALEDGLERNATHPAIAGLRHPGLARRAALESDLAVLRRLGMAPLAPIAEARAYAEHLRTLAATDAVLLVAHAWLRYLGDLNGGRVLARLVRDRLGVPEGAMAFYRFPAIADPAAAAVAWRLSLDAIDADPALQQRLVEEARDGFRRHIAMFEALDAPQDAADSSSDA